MSTTTAERDGRGAIEIGGVIQDTFRVIGRNFVAFFILALILTALPQAIVGYSNLQLAADDASLTAAVMVLVGVLVTIVAGVTLQGTIVHGTVMDMNGRKAAVSQSLAVGLRNFLPLLGMGILLGIAITLGLLLLIVPGVLMMLAWAVVVPAYIAERIGLFEAFSRSAQLTRDNRWRIFVLGLLFFFTVIVISVVGSAIGGAGAIVAGQSSMFYVVIVNPILSAFSALIGSTGAAVLYAHLRQAKEGMAPDSLAAIFD